MVRIQANAVSAAIAFSFERGKFQAKRYGE